MGISEKQFAEMLRGTIHEGKYGPTTKSKPAPAQAPKPVPAEEILPDGNGPEVEELARGIRRAIPIYTFAVVATSPAFWIALVLFITIVVLAFEPVMGLVFLCSTIYGLYSFSKWIYRQIFPE